MNDFDPAFSKKNQRPNRRFSFDNQPPRPLIIPGQTRSGQSYAPEYLYGTPFADNSFVSSTMYVARSPPPGTNNSNQLNGANMSESNDSSVNLDEVAARLAAQHQAEQAAAAAAAATAAVNTSGSVTNNSSGIPQLNAATVIVTPTTATVTQASTEPSVATSATSNTKEYDRRSHRFTNQIRQMFGEPSRNLSTILELPSDAETSNISLNIRPDEEAEDESIAQAKQSLVDMVTVLANQLDIISDDLIKNDRQTNEQITKLAGVIGEVRNSIPPPIISQNPYPQIYPPPLLPPGFMIPPYDASPVSTAPNITTSSHIPGTSSSHSSVMSASTINTTIAPPITTANTRYNVSSVTTPQAVTVPASASAPMTSTQLNWPIPPPVTSCPSNVANSFAGFQPPASSTHAYNASYPANDANMPLIYKYLRQTMPLHPLPSSSYAGALPHNQSSYQPQYQLPLPPHGISHPDEMARLAQEIEAKRNGHYSRRTAEGWGQKPPLFWQERTLYTDEERSRTFGWNCLEAPQYDELYIDDSKMDPSIRGLISGNKITPYCGIQDRRSVVEFIEELENQWIPACAHERQKIQVLTASITPEIRRALFMEQVTPPRYRVLRDTLINMHYDDSYQLLEVNRFLEKRYPDEKDQKLSSYFTKWMVKLYHNQIISVESFLLNMSIRIPHNFQSLVSLARMCGNNFRMIRDELVKWENTIMLNPHISQSAFPKPGVSAISYPHVTASKPPSLEQQHRPQPNSEKKFHKPKQATFQKKYRVNNLGVSEEYYEAESNSSADEFGDDVVSTPDPIIPAASPTNSFPSGVAMMPVQPMQYQQQPAVYPLYYQQAIPMNAYTGIGQVPQTVDATIAPTANSQSGNDRSKP